MSTVAQLYQLSLDQIATAIEINGEAQTTIVQGHMGIGKSSLLKMLAQRMPEYTPMYFDCTTKADSGDLVMPNVSIMDAEGFVRFVPNEELGLHLGKKLILMIDEIGKAERSLKTGLTRLLYERKLGNHTLDGIIFATTNLGVEGLGDLMQPHMRNRVTVVTARKPSVEEWIEWGINNNIDSTILGFARENPQVMQSFEEVEDPSKNPYIYHPKDAARLAFVTPRSLEAASKWVALRDRLDKQTLTAMLIGTIGEPAAMLLSTWVEIADQMPTLQSIRTDPTNAKVPDSSAARCMIVWRTLSIIERGWVGEWMTYLQRLGKEEQGMFANGVRSKKYDPTRRAAVMNNQKFAKWALDNNYMFAADAT
jgi:energy-coupling factor transporter ATP-binding protein EcfA2